VSVKRVRVRRGESTFWARVADHGARGRRAAGDAAFQQVEADMFRMAALFVVERLKPWLLTYLAALLAGGRCDSPAPRAARARRPERGAGCALRTLRATHLQCLRPWASDLLHRGCCAPAGGRAGALTVQLQACGVPVCCDVARMRSGPTPTTTRRSRRARRCRGPASRRTWTRLRMSWCAGFP